MTRILQLLVLTQVLSLTAQAQMTDNYRIVSLSEDSLVHADSLRLEVSFSDTNGRIVSGKVEIGIGAKTFRPIIDSQGMVGLTLHRKLAGKAIHFFSHDGYDLRTEPIDWESGNSLTMAVQFVPIQIRREYRPVAEKPVVYLYPERPMQVSVRVGFSGEYLFTYPEYVDGWDVMVYPSGEIEADGRKLRYLFWEGRLNAAHVPPDLSRGFVLGQDELVNFFERTLGNMGFSDSETADFITYWVPRMTQHESVFVHFLIDKEYEVISTLDIRPVPDRIIRLFMFWKGITSKTSIKIDEQSMPTFTRQGFTVVEWGGSELSELPFEPN